MTELHEGEEYALSDDEIVVTRIQRSGRPEYQLDFPAHDGHYQFGPIGEGAASVTVDEDTARRLALLISKHQEDHAARAGEEFLGALNTAKTRAWDDGYMTGWLDAQDDTPHAVINPYKDKNR